MKTIKGLFVAVTTLCVASCSAPLKVTTDYDKATNFTGYKTFVLDTLKVSQSVSQLNQNRITNAVKSEMTKKGFTENTSSPDLIISVATILKDKKSVSSNTDFYGYGGLYRPYAWDGVTTGTGYTTYDVQDYKDGSLIIDIADAKTKSLLWEGIGNRALDKPLKDPDADIAAAVETIMRNFPPGK